MNIKKMTNISISSDTLKFENSGVNYGAFTGGLIDGLVTLSSNYGNVRITGLQDPINLQDAATKNYTDSLVVNPQALTKTDDTNVILTLGGSPMTALFNATSLTLGWAGTLSGTRGGTGVNNGTNTITLGGNLTTSGAFSTTFTTTGNTSITLPTSGTLLNNSLTSGNIYIGSAGGVATSVSISGDATIINTGTLTLATVNASSGLTTLSSITTNAKGLVTSNTTGNLSGDVTSTGLTTTYNGIVPMSKGGTNASLTASNGGIFYSTATSSAILGGIAAAGRILRSGISSAPSWSTAVYPSTTVSNGILYSSGTNNVTTSSLLTYNGTTFTNSGTTASTSINTGVLTLGGGIGINNVTDASSKTNGGTFTTAGGVAIAKSLYVGLKVVLEDPGAGTNTITIRSPTLASDYSLTLPTTSGTSGYVLSTDGTGVLSWVQGGTGTGYVISVSGTSDRIDVSGTSTDPIVDISASYTGQTSITTLGTIASGTWNGSVITGQYGGTGIANTDKTITLGGNLTTSGEFNTTLNVTALTNVTLPVSGTLLSDVPSSLTSIDDVNIILTLGGTPTTALLKPVTITVGWDGQLGFDRGGTNANITPTLGGTFYTTATSTVLLPAGTTGQIIRMSGSTIPEWTSATYPFTTSINSILYSSGTNIIGEITTINNGVLTTDETGVPSITPTINIGEGTAAEPSYGFSTATTFGMYSSGTNILDFTTSSTNRISISATGITSLSNSTSSTSDITGALTLAGGIGISSTEDALSLTNGGTFTTAGGASIAKDFYVGGNIIIGKENRPRSIFAPAATSTNTIGGSLNIFAGRGNGIADGGYLTVKGGNGGTTTGTGGIVSITGGDGGNMSGNGGDLILNGGQSNGSGTYGGTAILKGGNCPGGNSSSGNVLITSGDIAGAASSGSVTIVTTNTVFANSGDISIASGNNTTTGNSGSITINTGTVVSGTVGDITLQTGGITRSIISTLSITNTIPILEAAGTVSAPSYSFTDDTNTGIYQNGDGTIYFANNAINSVIINRKTQLNSSSALSVGNSVLPPSTTNPDANGSSIFVAAAFPTAGIVIRGNNSAAHNYMSFYFGTTNIGTIQKNNGANTVSYITSSDYRKKKNIIDFKGGLSVCNNIQVKKFKWRKNNDDKNNDDENNDEYDIGFIAQQMYDVYPSVVSVPYKNFDNWGIDYGKLTVPLVSAVQELHTITKKEFSKNITEVGTKDINLTAYQIIYGIIHGEPTGNRSWILPSVSDIIPLVSEAYIGKIINITFNNNSVTKNVYIVLGNGMTSKYNSIKINSLSSLTVMLRIDNISFGSEAMSLFKC